MNKLASMRKRIHCHALYQDTYRHDRDLWEAFLTNLFGVSSTVELNEQQLKKLEWHLNQKSTPEQKTKRVFSYKSDKKIKVYENKSNKITTEQVDFIEYLWVKNSREKTPQSLRYFIKRTIGRLLFEGSHQVGAYAFLKLLSKGEASRVITAIKKLT